MVVSAISPISINNYYSSTSVGQANPYSGYEQLLALQELDDVASLGSSGSGSGAASIDSSLTGADLLDLSPAALNVLNGIETTDTLNGSTGLPAPTGAETVNINETITVTGTSGSGTSSAAGTSGGASVTATDAETLTAAQQAEVAAIVNEYAAAPVTQQTFSQIENALTAAGINPEQVSLQQLLTGYEYAYSPGFSFNEQVYSDTLASELAGA